MFQIHSLSARRGDEKLQKMKKNVQKFNSWRNWMNISLIITKDIETTEKGVKEEGLKYKTSKLKEESSHSLSSTHF